MKTLGNIIWFLFGGVIIFIEYMISGVLMCVTIIGIPFGIQIFKLGFLALWPFGKEIKSINNKTSVLLVIMNIIWLIFGGIFISISHILTGLFFFITIIGIPFGFQHIKLAKLALTPFGKEIYKI